MGYSRFDYIPYLKEKNALLRSDLKPSILRSFGINASQKQIDSVYRACYCGWILTGGYSKSPCRHTPIYSIDRLKVSLILVYGDDVVIKK